MPECPACGSTDTQKSSAVYEQGRTSTSASTKGFGASSSGRLGLFDASTHAEHITDAASKNGPPNIDSTVFAGGAILAIVAGLTVGVVTQASVFGLIFPGFLFALLFAILFLVYRLSQGPSVAQREADQRYAKQWYCLRCGGLFQSDGPSASPASDGPRG
jgi:hypothetical protein